LQERRIKHLYVGQHIIRMTSLQNKDGDWIFITPINGLELTKDINEEILVNRVTFVSREKLPRIRKRFKIPAPLSGLVKLNNQQDKGIEKQIKDFFSSSKTYAIVPYKGNPKAKEKDCIRLINDEINILALSQLGWSTRRFNRRIRIKTTDKRFFYRKISINKQDRGLTFGYKTTFNPVPFIIDKQWVDFHKRFFFFDLLKLIRGEIEISTKWRTTLHRISIFAGQSQNSNDFSSCFLWNVIALEMLLTDKGEKIADMLVKRSEYFLGWNEEWYKENYEKRIRDIYNKRCDFVHEGDQKYIQIEDLLFTDDLIFNILNNVLRCRNKIKSRKDIIDYSEKYEAEKLLNQKSKYQFKRFEIMRKTYTDEDYKEI